MLILEALADGDEEENRGEAGIILVREDDELRAAS